MNRARLTAICLLAGVAAGAVAGLAGVDPVTAGLLAFGTAGLLFIVRSTRDRRGG